MPDEVWRIDVMQSMDGNQIINSWHVASTLTPVAADFQAFVNSCVEPQIGLVSHGMNFEHLNIRRVDIAGGLTSIFSPTGWPKIGLKTTEQMPNYVCFLVKGGALGGSPPSRMRKFLAGMLEAHSKGNALDTLGLTDIGTITAAMQAYIDGGPQLRIITQHYTAPPDPIVDAWNEIATVTYSPISAIMSSRKKGRGS